MDLEWIFIVGCGATFNSYSLETCGDPYHYRRQWQRVCELIGMLKR